MTRFRTKLLFALILLITVVLLAVGLLLGQLFKSYYGNIFNDRFAKESEFIADYIEENGGIADFLSHPQPSVKKLLGENFTLLNDNGQVLYERNDNRENSPDIHESLLKKIAGTKMSGQDAGYEWPQHQPGLRYYWAEIYDGEELAGYAVLTNEAEAIEEVNRHMWQVLGGSLGASLIIIILLGGRIAGRYSKPIETATKTAIELAQGNYRARAYTEQKDETGMLNTSLNILARNLQEMEISRAMQQDRLETLIENIGSGVLLIDHKGYITLTNRAYKELFEVELSEFLYHLYYEVAGHQEIIGLIEEIFMTEKSIKRQMEIPLHIERRHFEVYGAPIIGTHDEWKGILVVFHDITELKRLEQVRKDFVANVSHELRTPITSIKGFSETLLDGAMKDEKALVSFLEIILKESDRLQSMIQELLDLSRIEQQEFTLNLTPVDLGAILGESGAILAGKAREKEIELTVSLPDKPLIIEGDAARLKQVFINLLTNAVVYTPQGGKVHAALSDAGDRAVVTVKDSGVGIHTSEVPRIFERFYRVDKARSRDSGGTGLGLAIVKHIIEVMKGKIAVQSEPGQGTEFTVTLRKSQGRG